MMSLPQDQQPQWQSQLQSPLFRLPAELRKEIWTYVLECGEVHLNKPLSLSLESQKAYTLPRDNESYPQLLGTCRQAYDEGHCSFYSSNTFFLSLAKIRTADGDVSGQLGR